MLTSTAHSLVWHEAVPQIIYSQLVGWGMNLLDLLIIFCATFVVDEKVEETLAVLAPLGFETGSFSGLSNTTLFFETSTYLGTLVERIGLFRTAWSLSIGILLRSIEGRA